MDNILFQCVETRKQRDLIKLQLRTQKKWPANKLELITKHRKVFSEYIESIDLESLQQKVINRTVIVSVGHTVKWNCTKEGYIRQK